MNTTINPGSSCVESPGSFNDFQQRQAESGVSSNGADQLSQYSEAIMTGESTGSFEDFTDSTLTASEANVAATGFREYTRALIEHKKALTRSLPLQV